MNSLPYWLGTYLMMLGVGGVFALVLLYVITPIRLLKYTGTIPGMTANWVSIERVPVTLYGFGIWFTADGDQSQLWLGFLVTVLGLSMDRLDGKIAKAIISRLRFLLTIRMIGSDGKSVYGNSSEVLSPPLTRDNQLWAWYEMKEVVVTRVPRKPGSRRLRKHRTEKKTLKPVLLEDWIHGLTPFHTFVPMFIIVKQEGGNHAGLHLKLTGLGEVIDPGADKLCYLPIFAYLAMMGHLQMTAAVLMIAVDIFGTILRRPFDTLPGFRRLQRLVGEEKASPYGKTKVAFQIFTLLAIMPETAGWLGGKGQVVSFWLTSGLLWLAVLMGVLSVLSRMVFWQSLAKKIGIARFNRRFRKFYEHDIAN